MIKENNILFTGGSGLLGTEIKKILPQALYPSSVEFNVADFGQMENYIKNKDVKLFFHVAAFTSPPKVDQNPEKALETNIIGTSNVVRVCIKHGLRLIYMSTDYVFDGEKGNYSEEDAVYPVNKYAWSKLGGECAVRLYDNSLIVRTSFGPDVFPYDKAFADQWTSREKVSLLAAKLKKIVFSDLTRVIHVSGPRQTVLEYAQSLGGEKEIKPLLRNEVNFKVPKDTSLNSELYNKLIQ